LVHLVSSRIANLKPEKGNQTISGLIISQRIVKTKRGDNMAIVTLDDRTGRMDITLFAEAYNNARDLLLKDGLLVISGQVRYDDYSGMLKMSAENVRLLADVRQERAREICLVLESGSLVANFTRELIETLEPYRQNLPQQTGCAIVIDYIRSDARARLRFNETWRVRPEDELLQRLRDCYGSGAVNLVY
jgi:DNA polymerase III subunit alpha